MWMGMSLSGMQVYVLVCDFERNYVWKKWGNGGQAVRLARCDFRVMHR